MYEGREERNIIQGRVSVVIFKGLFASLFLVLFIAACATTGLRQSTVTEVLSEDIVPESTPSAKDTSRYANLLGCSVENLEKSHGAPDSTGIVSAGKEWFSRMRYWNIKFMGKPATLEIDEHNQRVGQVSIRFAPMPANEEQQFINEIREDFSAEHGECYRRSSTGNEWRDEKGNILGFSLTSPSLEIKYTSESWLEFIGSKPVAYSQAKEQEPGSAVYSSTGEEKVKMMALFPPFKREKPRKTGTSPTEHPGGLESAETARDVYDYAGVETSMIAKDPFKVVREGQKTLRDEKGKAEPKRPAAAFLAFHDALYKKDIVTARKYLAKSMLAGFREGGFVQSAKLWRALVETFPEELKITGQEIKDSKAFVTVTVESKSDEPVSSGREEEVAKPESVIDKKGTVTMVKEGGEWKVASIEWK